MTAVHMAGALIASVPTVIGYFPQHSLVVMTFRRGHLGATTAVDLSPDVGVASRVASWAESVRAEAAVAVVVDDAVDATRSPLCQALHSALALNGITLLAIHVVPEIAPGVRWVCGDGCGASGLVEDPATTPVALAGVVTGRRIYASRAQLSDAVAIADEQRTAQIADMIHAHCNAQTVDDCDDQTARQTVDHAIAVAKRVSRGGQLRNEDYIQLARTLTNTRVRDMLPGFAVTSKASRLEVLWTVLARTLRDPWRAEALVLLGFLAYIRSDLPLAEVAIEAALQSDPAHKMAGTLASALRTGRRPKRIWELGEFAYDIARMAGVRMPRRIVHVRRSA